MSEGCPYDEVSGLLYIEENKKLTEEEYIFAKQRTKK